MDDGGQWATLRGLRKAEREIDRIVSALFGLTEEEIGMVEGGTMTYHPDIHHRRSMRLQGYDYSRAGAYFVTLCTQNRECLFGEIENGKMVLNDAGRMVQIVHDEMEPNYPGVKTDDFIVMPNHIHGIIILVGAGPCACPETGQPRNDGQPRGVAPTLSLPDVVHRFKTMTTKRYTDGVKQSGWPPPSHPAHEAGETRDPRPQTRF